MTSDSGSVQIPVVMEVGGVPDVAGGALYVQLRNPDTFESIYSEMVFSDNGVYRFNFDGVATGRYLISASTDLDNDKSIGDDGEAYLSLAQPLELQVNQNLSGLTLGAGFNIAFSAQAR
ncbi:MAG: hypothetical protein WAM61_18760 [Desulfobacterales bacterium]